jgi:CHAT domain-containing protein/tetratricopeptide (TPR) repeat protein
MKPTACGLRLVVVAFALTAPFCFGPARAARGGDVAEALRQAEELFARDDLPPAEKLYAQVLASSQARDHRLLCYERLLAIYMRSGRFDRAVDHGQKFIAWLKDSDDPARLRRIHLQVGWSFVQLGHYAAAEAPLQEALKEAKGVAALPVSQRLTALTLFARAAEARGLKSAASRWQDVEQLAVATLSRAATDLGPGDLNECVWKLSESCRFQGKHDLAIQKLTAWLPTHDNRSDWPGKRETLRLRAGHYASTARLAEAEKDLRAALEMHAKSGPDRLMSGDLDVELADILHRAGKKKEATEVRQEAAEHFLAVLKDPTQAKAGAGGTSAAFWKLQTLYQRSRQYKAALELTATQAEAWAGGNLLTPKLRAEEGNLHGIRGAYGEARKSLRLAVAELELQSPPSLIDLPRAFVNLAACELATDDTAAAEALARKTLALYAKYALKDDLVLVEVYTILGGCAAQNGDYAVAIAHFRDGLERCAKLGAPAAPQEAHLFLNIALLLKAQGELTEALAYCEKAATAHARYAEPDDLGFAALDAARAGILSARGKVEDAARLAPRILEICARNEVTGGPLVITAKHCFALDRLLKGDHGAAEAAWQDVRRLQEKDQQALLLPRTLNYLALSAELQGQWDIAEEWYRRAAKLQADNPRAFPVTHYNTLHGLALVLDKRGQPKQAREILARAIAVVEKARFQVYGDSRQRAIFFAQFGPAFDLMVEWCLRDGDVEGALTASVRGRSRTMLDQLQMAGVDPRKGLAGSKAEKYLKREVELKRTISALRAKALLLPLGENSEQAKALLAAFDDAQHEFAEVWREILNASGVYRALSEQDVTATLASLRGGIVGPKTAVLVYHIGRERSYVFLGTDGLRKLEAFPLHVPAAVAKNLAAPPLPTTEEMLSGGRGLVLKKHKQPDVAPPEKRAVPQTPLGHDVTGLLVDHYRNHISDPEFVTVRGFQLKALDPAQPLPVQPLELMGDMLVPPEVRLRLHQAGAANVLIVPDGALHRLPFEALVVRGGMKGRYLLDELPPLAYAPSLAILANIGKRPAVARKGALTLLTVGNPAYGAEKAKGLDPALQTDLAGLRSHLPPLPFTEAECNAVRKHFPVAAVKALLGKDATEKNVVAAMPGRHVIHLAVHGFADDRFGNLFGALALTPPPPGAEDEDGFLTLYEIYQLPLQDCELAVLSACVTNVGPQLPKEAGITLASGFLSAGARRVVASHWSVDDRSTALLMGYFFEEVARAAEGGQSLGCAAALHKARLRLRGEGGWSSPFYWAPFVVLGPAD